MSHWFEHDPSGRLRVRERGDMPGLFGVPFMAAGLFAALVGLGVVTLANSDEVPAFIQSLLLIVGIIFGAAGAGVAFGRRSVTIDHADGLVLAETWTVIRIQAQVHRLDDHEAVVIAYEEGDSDRADQFPVSLLSRDWRSLRLCSPLTYAEAWECAVAVAQYARLPLEDVTTDHPLRVSSGEVDLPLIHRVTLDQETAVDRPEAPRATVLDSNDGIRIVVPMKRAHRLAVAPALIPIAILGVAIGPLARFFEQSGTPTFVAWTFIASLTFMFEVLPGLLVLTTLLKSRWGSTMVKVSCAGLEVQEHGAWRTKRKASFKAEEIVDVDYSTSESMATKTRHEADQRSIDRQPLQPSRAPMGVREELLLAGFDRFAKGKGITIKATKELATFGEGLPDDEIRYLHALVRRRLLSGGSGPLLH
jgi:hypothetical protein